MSATKNTYFILLFSLLTLLVFSCKKKESEQFKIPIDDICQEWELTSIKYTHPDTDREFEFVPYYDITLKILKGGKYELDDQWGLLNMKPFNGTGFASKDIQRKYGSWEFTNESQPDQIVFNKGASTYGLWNESGANYYYVFSDPEYVFNYKLQNDEMTFTSTDYNLMYMYGFYIAYDDAYYYCPSCLVNDVYADGYDVGGYYGYAAGYNNGALEVYNDSTKSIKVYRKDPFYNGMVDGRLENLYYFDYLNADLSATPAYESGFNDGYSDEYYTGFDEGEKYAKRLTTDPGKVELIFKLK